MNKEGEALKDVSDFVRAFFLMNSAYKQVRKYIEIENDKLAGLIFEAQKECLRIMVEEITSCAVDKIKFQ